LAYWLRQVLSFIAGLSPHPILPQAEANVATELREVREALVALTSMLDPRRSCAGRARRIRPARRHVQPAHCKWQRNPAGPSAPPAPPALATSDVAVTANEHPAPTPTGWAVPAALGVRASINSPARKDTPASWDGDDDNLQQAPHGNPRKEAGRAQGAWVDVGDGAQSPALSGADEKYGWGLGAGATYANGSFPAVKLLDSSEEAGSRQAVPPRGSDGGGSGGDGGYGKSGGGGGSADGEVGGQGRMGWGGSNSGSAAAWHSINGGACGDLPPLWLPPPSAPAASAFQVSSMLPWSNGPEGSAPGDGVSFMLIGSNRSQGDSPLVMPTQDYGRRRGSALAAAAAAAAASSWQTSPRVASTAPVAQAGWRMHI
jgi:hypothetical protein